MKETCVDLEYEIVGVDFDKTLSMTSRLCPACGDPSYGIDVLKRFKQRGGKVILWTCRSAEWAEDAVMFCRQYGLEFDAVNKHLEIQLQKFKEMYPDDMDKADSRKCFFDMYIDDKDPHAIARGGIDWTLVDLLLNGEEARSMPAKGSQMYEMAKTFAERSGRTIPMAVYQLGLVDMADLPPILPIAS